MNQNTSQTAQPNSQNTSSQAYQAALTQTAQPAAGQGAGQAAAQAPAAANQFSQIIEQVTNLKQSLHDFVDQEDFPDAAIIAASGVLEHHLDHYQQLALQKENQKPGMETL
ncbi:MAG: hypothetical protein E6X17_02440 [Sporomusaceae bacterium]|nr:hypothetical protein [Sporomusaceae bacterium]